MTVQLKGVYQADVEQKMRNIYDCLSEKDRRRYAAAEVVKLGYGGVARSCSFTSYEQRRIALPGNSRPDHENKIRLGGAFQVADDGQL